MGKIKLGRYKLCLIGTIFMAFIFCQLQGAFAWEYKKLGYKLDGKFKFPPRTDIGKKEHQWQTLYPIEEQEKNLIKRYDSTNVDEIKDLLPSYLYDLTKNPKEWNNDKWTINLVKYKKFAPGGKFMEWTEKNKGRAALDENGDLINFDGGYLPFHPDYINEDDPQAGLKIAYNVYYGPRNSDDQNLVHSDTIVDRNWNERITHGAWLDLGITGRSFIEPMPSIPGNKKNLYRIQIFGWAYPYDIRGIIALTYRYEDQFKWDDQWLYIPAIRRARRMAASNRQDSTGTGDDATFDDLECWNGKPLQYTWKYLGRKEFIVQRMCKALSDYKPGQVTGFDDYYQKVNMYVIETSPKESVFGPHIYSKIWLLVDPDLWWFTNGMYYDNRGNFWKSMQDFTSLEATQGAYRISNPLQMDWQRKHHSDHRSYYFETNVGIAPEWFTLGNARKFYGIQK